MSGAAKGAANPRVKQRLDTGMFFVAFDNGDIYKGGNGEKFFADIRDAYKAKEQILAQRDQTEGNDNENV